MKGKIYIITFLSFLTFLSCSEKEDEIKNTYQVISLIYTNIMNQVDIPPPLPPPPPISKGEYSQKQIDSINLAYLKLRQRLISKSIKKKKT
ncbi:MAG: hypothetical protein ACWIPI_10575 [Polaribacter sp.]